MALPSSSPQFSDVSITTPSLRVRVARGAHRPSGHRQASGCHAENVAQLTYRLLERGGPSSSAQQIPIVCAVVGLPSVSMGQ
jgi:hypothetical protein